jgi:hypothetical protein
MCLRSCKLFCRDGVYNKKELELDVVANAYNPSYSGAELERISVQG